MMLGCQVEETALINFGVRQRRAEAFCGTIFEVFTTRDVAERVDGRRPLLPYGNGGDFPHAEFSLKNLSELFNVDGGNGDPIQLSPKIGAPILIGG